MKKRDQKLRNPLHQGISADFIAAKNNLRDRLFLRIEEAVPQARALRKAKRYQPAVGVNVVGLGIGEKTTAGKPTGEMCVKVFVAKKYPKGRVGRNQQIPGEVNGFPTDVEGIGYPKKFAIDQRNRHRPVTGGVSVGLDYDAVDYSFAGTLGAVVMDRKDHSRLYALSNNHVLADENLAPIGAGVVQPGTLDNGRNADRVATLTRFVTLKYDNRRNWMDAAIAEFSAGIAVDRSILAIGTPSGAGKPQLNMTVRKSGRTTGLTEGIVRAVNSDIFDIEYDQGMVRVDDVIVVKGTDGAFSKAGDSGSAIVDSQGKVVALLFAGSDLVTFAIPIQRILTRFKVRIAT